MVSNVYAQASGIVEANGGIRFSITPVHLQNRHASTVLNQNPVLLQEDPHLSGMSLSFGLNYFLMSDLFISYEAYMRYDVFLSTLDSTTRSFSENKKLMLDNQVGLLYNVVKRESIIIATGLGFSFNNSNTKYSFATAVYDPERDVYDISHGEDSYKFTTLGLPIYLKFKNNVELGLKTSYTLTHKFKMPPDDLLLFSLTARYSFKLNDKN